MNAPISIIPADGGSTFAVALSVSLLAGFAAIVLGRNLTRSLVACVIAVAGLTTALAAVGLGRAGFLLGGLALLFLILLQAFGVMLVDIDRDSVPRPDLGTWIARLLAFALLGAGLSLLALGLMRGVEAIATASATATFQDPGLGRRIFGDWHELATLCGLAVGAVLLGTLMLFDDERERR